MANSVLECSFFIPIRRDANLADAELHSTQVWEWIAAGLFERFDGATMAPGLFSGFYRDPDTNERVDDESRKFVVAIEETKVEDLRSLLRGAGVIFQQKCIYLSIAGRVEFIESHHEEIE